MCKELSRNCDTESDVNFDTQQLSVPVPPKVCLSCLSISSSELQVPHLLMLCES